MSALAHPHAHLRGHSQGRLHRGRGLLAFLGGFFALMLVGGAISAALAPKTKALCAPARPCGTPPHTVASVVSGSVWRSSRYGYTLEYFPAEAAIVEHDPGGLILAPKLNGGATAIVVDGYSAAQTSPSAAIGRQIGALQGISGVAGDPSLAHELLGPSVGLHPGTGRMQVGDLNAPQGPGQPVELASEAAQHGRLTVAVTVIGGPHDSGPSSILYQLADQIINSVRWPGG